ncbi:MAG: hypothetical protein L6R42_010719 [Xanthoria sp. 1 TBL-2021]|nr:MAG: hypothetical protein L6R42_010719 [Xanthoria sp. 1 TBL-2021]
MPVRESRATKARGAVSSLDDNDDDSDPGHEIGTTRETKRQRFYDSDQAQLELQLGQSHLTNAAVRSEEESDTDTEIPTSRGSRTPVDKKYRPATTIGYDGRTTCPSKRRKRIEDNGKPRQIQPYKRCDHKNTHLPQWPAAMMSIGPKDNPRYGISSERAIKMVEQRAKVKGVNMTTSYAAFFARLFSLDTMENLTNGCRRYNTIMTSLSPTERNPVNQIQVTESATMSGAPEEVKELVKIYLNIQIDDKVCGVVIGNAINYHQQTLFARKLTIVHNHIMDRDSEISMFLKKWVVEAGKRVPSSRVPWVNELNSFIMSQASGGQVRQQEDVNEWRQQRARFGRMCRLGGNLDTLSEMCTGAIWLLVGAMRGGKTHDLNEYMKPDHLRGFVGEVLEMVPEYSTCFKELDERLWKPILERQQLPSIRLLNIDGDPEALKTELKKKSVRYWLEFDDAAKMDVD